MLGFALGNDEGAFDGDKLGRLDGEKDTDGFADFVGAELGFIETDGAALNEGGEEGWTDGTELGSDDGEELGFVLGTADGATDGTADGVLLGLADGDELGLSDTDGA